MRIKGENRMKKYTSIIVAGITVLGAVFLLYKEYDPTRIKQTESHTEAHWTYAGEKNVFTWGDIEGARLCKIGQAQSPIDLPKEVAKGTSDYVFHYTETKFVSENNGHTIQYTPVAENENRLELNGEVYQLAQFHFHNPSEHAVGGVLYPMEVHFVHKSASGKLAVVGTVIKASEVPTMHGYWLEDGKTKVEKSVNLSTLIQGGGKHYKGSLTTPPCTEGIEWLVLDQEQTMTQAEIHTYRKIFGSETNRPVQPVNGREITQT